MYHRQERVRKANANGSHTNKEWEELKKAYDWRCARCGKKEPFLDLIYPWLTVDHIIPLIKGGSDYITNIQPLCIRCNDIKGTRIIRYLDYFLGRESVHVGGRSSLWGISLFSPKKAI